MADETANLVEGTLDAYRRGFFPMADPPHPPDARGRPGPIRWYSPNPRAILPLTPPEFHVPRTVLKRIRSGRFDIRSDTAFEQVIRACAEPRPGRGETWIDQRIIHAYTALHRAGHAHSVEAWTRPCAPGCGALAGGVYGVAIGAAFFAESMFCRPELGGTDASSVCLVELVTHLRTRGYGLFDIQILNDHTARFGGIEIPRFRYLDLLFQQTSQPNPAWNWPKLTTKTGQI